ncbi:aminodeoxychorismate/anthranilate synthase component II [Francisella philomiragia]|uniref:anthranilate synthase n=1 Tax=Francisella philomiragia subsp. philomiragia (strain ATCC 25017 / CCUG 19701 / FSC 153 / O\|nr:aminodeoxychorismate/anthranilate synthase component II [Francisella philomiragia]AJI47067.1 anthranilate synthase component II [Francisella philomiragia]AJI49121.1 glutamine amidotransferase of anthranilate synthase/aminodeoxychorismate synthase family protein [Francisella philomiragia]MBK2021139.1 aminodeoxychorismate/anthranilate synthase component II [Francisella philomiragia]MBK2030934.1 aminodeoxychorismate/anthranilate synthase component II [Francisella philomiragia]MBK2264480.1 amin
MANIIFIDNFDSFSYNLVDEFRVLGNNVEVFRNNLYLEVLLDKINSTDNPIVVISPGPGNPASAGCIVDLISVIKGKVPIIGICLGHQAIVEAYGGIVSHANEIVHGKTAKVKFIKHDIFDGLESPLSVARYHSLVAIKVPTCLETVAEVNDLVMAVVDDKNKVCGLQFHPESIMTIHGSKLLDNIVKWVQQ